VASKAIMLSPNILTPQAQTRSYRDPVSSKPHHILQQSIIQHHPRKRSWEQWPHPIRQWEMWFFKML